MEKKIELCVEGATNKLMPRVELRLRQEGNSVFLMCGEWYILQIRQDGTLKRCNWLPNSMGLQLDDDGRIVISE